MPKAHNVSNLYNRINRIQSYTIKKYEIFKEPQTHNK